MQMQPRRTVERPKEKGKRVYLRGSRRNCLQED